MIVCVFGEGSWKHSKSLGQMRCGDTISLFPKIVEISLSMTYKCDDLDSEWKRKNTNKFLSKIRIHQALAACYWALILWSHFQFSRTDKTGFDMGVHKTFYSFNDSLFNPHIDSFLVYRIRLMNVINAHVTLDLVNANSHKRKELFCATILLTCATIPWNCTLCSAVERNSNVITVSNPVFNFVWSIFKIFDNTNAAQLVDVWVHTGMPGLRILSFWLSTSFIRWYQAVTDFSERSSVALQIWHPISGFGLFGVSIDENQITRSPKEESLILSMEWLDCFVFKHIRYHSWWFLSLNFLITPSSLCNLMRLLTGEGSKSSMLDVLSMHTS